MAQFMKEVGSLGMLRATANSFTSMVMFTKAIGGMIRPTASASTSMSMVSALKAIGRTTYIKGWAKSNWLMDLCTRGSTLPAKSMAGVPTGGTTDLGIMANGRRTRLRD